MPSRIFLKEGQRFGRLTVIGLHHRVPKKLTSGYIHNQDYMLCKCDCGNEKIASKRGLIRGHIKSCGCLNYEKTDNIFIEKDGYCEMLVNRKDKKEPIVVLVDKEDVDRLKALRWCAKFEKSINSYYINGWERRYREKKERRSFRLHRFIMNPPDDMQIDHINHNTLDNRKCNLRICTQQENANNKGLYRNNKSGYKHIYYLNYEKMWCCEIKRNKKTIFKKRSKSFDVVLEARNNFIKENGGKYDIN